MHVSLEGFAVLGGFSAMLLAAVAVFDDYMRRHSK
jgi:hypothetical protein